MGTPGHASDATRDEVLCLFTPSDQPSTPLTTTEVADRLECEEATAEDRLEALTDQGELDSRRITSPARIWWPTRDGDTEAATSDDQSTQFRSFISAVKDYATFTLDPEGHVVSWNDGAERIKGYEEDILGRHFSTFHTEDDVANDVPQENLTGAKEAVSRKVS